MPTLDDFTRQLEQAPQRAARRISGRMIQAQRSLLQVARAVVHVRSHNLQSRLAIEPPTVIDASAVDFIVTSTAPYAEYEVAKGDEHDYPARTLEEGADIVQSAA